MDVGQKGGRAGSGEQQRPFGDAFVNLVLAGGAHRCVAFLGFLRAARADGGLRRVRNVVGASAGAIVGLAFCLDVDDDAVIRSAAGAARGGIAPDLALLIDHFGAERTETRVAKLATDIITAGLVLAETRRGAVGTGGRSAQQLTFRELAEVTGHNLVVVATRCSDMTSRTFCVDLTPGVRVVDAVCASCAVPLLLTPVLIDGETYVDAAVSENAPVRSLRAACGPPPAPGVVDTLLLRCDPRWSLATTGDGSKGDDLLQFTLRIVSTLLNRAMHTDDVEMGRCRVVELPRAQSLPADADVLWCGVTARDMLSLYAVGVAAFSDNFPV
jgi:hypothetical protein